jgi:hypothetical protein
MVHIKQKSLIDKNRIGDVMVSVLASGAINLLFFSFFFYLFFNSQGDF